MGRCRGGDTGGRKGGDRGRVWVDRQVEGGVEIGEGFGLIDMVTIC